MNSHIHFFGSKSMTKFMNCHMNSVHERSSCGSWIVSWTRFMNCHMNSVHVFHESSNELSSWTKFMRFMTRQMNKFMWFTHRHRNSINNLIKLINGHNKLHVFINRRIDQHINRVHEILVVDVWEQSTWVLGLWNGQRLDFITLIEHLDIIKGERYTCTWEIMGNYEMMTHW